MDDIAQNNRTIFRACNLCEAICGVAIKVAGDKIESIRGDDEDPFSRGHICPKAIAIQDIHEDPDRLRRPMLRVGETGEDAQWREISWDEAYDLVAENIAAVIAAHGNNAVGLYAGNPNVHNFGHILNYTAFAKLIKSKNIFSASSVDQLPQQLASYFMFGHQFLIPIPDIDHTDYFLMLGANPIASNGSLMTAPDVAKRLKALQTRGGKLVVIDPRRTETADVASEHYFITPGSDAAFLSALLTTMREENLLRPIAPEQLVGFTEALNAISSFTAESVANFCGIEASTIRHIARNFCAAKTAVCYGRMGTTTQAFGTLNQWLIYLINIATGNMDNVGGALLATPLMPLTGAGTRPGGHARWHSRVRGLPESNGELPVAVLAEEIFTAGVGQIRALFTIAGNPVLSTPNGRQVDAALAQLDFMFSIDIYINETTRHANIILPPTSALNHDHYDASFNAFAVRNVTRLNQAIWQRADDERYDWEIFSGICTRLSTKLGREYKPPHSVREVVKLSTEHSLYAQGISFDALLAASHGIDMGALRPSLFSRLETENKKIHCAPQVLLADIPRLQAALRAAPSTALALIGRRHVRSNNSWMHNSHRLVKGKPRHQLLMHPADMAARNILDGSRVRIQARVGNIEIEVQANTDMMQGVVSLPHGFGHGRAGVKMAIAQAHAGESANDLTDEMLLDAVSGNAAINGVLVEVFAV